MKLLGPIIIVCVLKFAIAIQSRTHSGSYEFNSASLKPTKKEHVIYKLCLKSAPEFFTATARPSDLSLPHKFNLTVLQIMKPNAVVKLERTDGPTEWENINITVDWHIVLEIGNGMMYGGQYIWMPDPRKLSLNKLQAEQQCTLVGGKLVDIVDKEMFNAVTNYVIATYTGGAYVDIWTGMTFRPNAATNKLTQSNGQPAYDPATPDSNWYTGYPVFQIDRTGVLILVSDTSALVHVGIGLYNKNPSTFVSPTSSPLCSFNLK